MFTHKKKAKADYRSYFVQKKIMEQELVKGADDDYNFKIMITKLSFKSMHYPLVSHLSLVSVLRLVLYYVGTNEAWSWFCPNAFQIVCKIDSLNCVCGNF